MNSSMFVLSERVFNFILCEQEIERNSFTFRIRWVVSHKISMSRELSDSEIILLTLEDSDNFAYIIDRYEKKLFRYIMRLWDFSLPDAEDILQEVFIKAYTHINEYDLFFPFSSWIYRIAHNTTIDTFRKKSTKITICLDDEEYEWLRAVLQSDENVHFSIMEKDMKETVQNSLSTLSDEQREVIILKYIEWRDYSEISDILRIPIGTVGTLIHRAKKQLQWSLTPIHNHL